MMIVPHVVAVLAVVALTYVFVRTGITLCNSHSAPQNKGHDERLRMAELEPDTVLVFAGEINGPFYRDWVRVAEDTNRELKMKFLAGPTINVCQEDFDKFFSSDGRIKETGDLLKVHPLFCFMLRHPDRIEIRIKGRSLPEEKHFAVGVKSRRVHCEHHHGDGLPKGGWVFNGVASMYSAKRREFESMWDCESFCQPLTVHNYKQVLSEVIFRPSPLREAVRGPQG